MSDSDVYVQLIQELNYPNRTSDYLIRILKKMATVNDAKLLLALPAASDVLAARTGLSEDKVQERIQELTEKGLVVPSREGPRFVSSVTQFHDANLSSSKKWVDTELLDLWKEFYEIEWFPAMANVTWDQYVQYVRVVPAWAAVQKSPQLSPEDLPPEENLRDLVKSAEFIAVVPCTCRRSMRRCQADLDNCIQFNRGAQYAIDRGAGRRISVEEAMKIFEESEKAGLVHTWPFAASKHLNEICNCCIDCCGIFDAGLKYDNLTAVLQKSHLRAKVDTDLCNGCQDCVERCFFGAIEMKSHPKDKRLKAEVDEEKCFGCGVCVLGCPVDAITMRRVAPQAR